ncbi:helix-turn-helix transcriptional regulator [Comamonas sp.]|uniref:AraC family transcriptional regulator n=1 Tax=Comamonas sp. TaxID=34028 RepID=UPI0012D13352|nr:helix-turn-helix transcriptional regulator [Comamonas sp.]MPS92350.1 AraC family transcriptional regulator [Comamonas sp.]
MGFSSPEHGAHALDLQPAQASSLPVTGVEQRYPPGHMVPQHIHARGHLIYASEGVLLVESPSGQWLVPPTTAVWLRPGMLHRITATTAVRALGLFIDQSGSARLPAQDCVIHVSPLVRELMAAIVGLPHQGRHSARDLLLGDLLMEELRALAPLPYYLPWPEDALMRRICEGVLHAPAHRVTAQALARQHALTPKTLHRRFLRSTGMSWGRWYQQLRLMTSIPALLRGVPITAVALESGYESHSAYTAAFRKQFGRPPSAFAAAAGGATLR